MLPILLAGAALALDLPHETYTLDNGLTVVLHEDHSLPQVVVDVWYRVGSRDEVDGRSGFAHLFEHLMFMGTARLPDAGYDELMEAQGGWNNAWTSEDETNYFDVGPSHITDLLLWMEADRMDGLGKAMTQDKLDLQRDVVRNERRQTTEDAPYGELELLIPTALFPDGHPYDHPVIGSHEDLQAATVDDVKGFFARHYVPGNATLVVAGDFDPAAVKQQIAATFGAVASAEVPERVQPEALDAPVHALVEGTDDVGQPKTWMLWHSPAVFQPGDAELDLAAAVLSTGRSSRLYRRIVQAEAAALEVNAFQYSAGLGSYFVVEVLPAEGHDLDEVEGLVAEELARLAEEGPTEAELARAKARWEMSFLQEMEPIMYRAINLARYHALTGDPDYFDEDIGRYRAATAEGLREQVSRLTPERRSVIRIRPAAEPEGGGQ